MNLKLATEQVELTKRRFVLKPMDSVPKMMDFVLKKTDFVGGRRASGRRRGRRVAAGLVGCWVC